MDETLTNSILALVSVTPLAELPDRPRRKTLVSLDGAFVCGKCGMKGHVPGHMSLIFWTFWSRTQLQALVDAMRPGERLHWIAHRLVRVQTADGRERHLREEDGAWREEANQQ